MAIAQLRLKQGVPAAPADPNSAEQGIIKHINLMSPEGTDGFRLDTAQNWMPQRAQWKNGGVWVESAINDGRQLLAAARGNVLETIPLILVAESQTSINFYMRELGRFAQAVTDFHEGRDIEPPYLELEGVDAPRAQYALVFMVNIADRNLAYPDVGQKPAVGVTLTIEREAGWRMIWPGGNPIECHFQLQGKTRGVTTPGEGYTYSDMSLYENTDHFHYEQIQNRVEYDPTAYSTLLTKNWIDIDGTDIPGDMPALCLIDTEAFFEAGVTNSHQMHRLYIARSTKPITGIARTGTNPTKLRTDILNAGDSSTVSGSWGKVNDTDGVISNGSSTLQYFQRRAFASAAAARETAFRWQFSFQDLDLNTLRGTYLVFLRALGSPNTLTDGAFNMWLTFIDSNLNSFAYSNQIELGPVNHIHVVTSNDITGLSYFGQINLPFDRYPKVGTDGLGLNITTAEYPNLVINFDIQKIDAASAFTITVLDLILLPFDECLAMIDESEIDNASQTAHFLLDNTGYLTHGKEVSVAYKHAPDAGSSSKSPVTTEVFGQSISLIPGIDNRLYFLKTNLDTGSTNREESRKHHQMRVRLNIVPRWSGMVDV